jgi:hypothetical protein
MIVNEMPPCHGCVQYKKMPFKKNDDGSWEEREWCCELFRYIEIREDGTYKHEEVRVTVPNGQKRLLPLDDTMLVHGDGKDYKLVKVTSCNPVSPETFLRALKQLPW